MAFLPATILLGFLSVPSIGSVMCGSGYLHNREKMTVFQLTGENVVLTPSLSSFSKKFSASKVKWKAISWNKNLTRERLYKKLSVSRAGLLTISVIEPSLNGSVFVFAYGDSKPYGSVTVTVGTAPKFHNISNNLQECSCTTHRNSRTICFQTSGHPVPIVTLDFNGGVVNWEMTSLRVICVEVDCCLGVTLVASNCFGNDTATIQGESCTSNVSRHLPGPASNLDSTLISMRLDHQDTLLTCSKLGDDHPHQKPTSLQQIGRLTYSEWVGIVVSLAVMLLVALAVFSALVLCQIRKKNHSKTSISICHEPNQDQRRDGTLDNYRQVQVPVTRSMIQQDVAYLEPAPVRRGSDEYDSCYYASMEAYDMSDQVKSYKEKFDIQNVSYESLEVR